MVIDAPCNSGGVSCTASQNEVSELKLLTSTLSLSRTTGERLPKNKVGKLSSEGNAEEFCPRDINGREDIMKMKHNFCAYFVVRRGFLMFL